ncbi:hypothetical protein BpHYR1_054545 [Brachionus plicatilis]|uniref:Uncharacterized protein n=1 Tax=Brachionus plicatilis TaxID=10195 RepID=A0A3M7SET4_BRAPC|nr:hypothetical protein BpHYR1_054545 [Brachionus plicatilis]
MHLQMPAEPPPFCNLVLIINNERRLQNWTQGVFDHCIRLPFLLEISQYIIPGTTYDSRSCTLPGQLSMDNHICLIVIFRGLYFIYCFTYIFIFSNPWDYILFDSKKCSFWLFFNEARGGQLDPENVYLRISAKIHESAES